MTWPRLPLPARMLLALLVLAAAFAYPLRLGPGVGETTRPTEVVHHEHTRGETATEETPTSPSHLAHCLFCLTGAFALTPDQAPAPSLAGVAFHVGRAPTPRAAHGLPSPPQARAPPLHLSI